MATTLVLDAHVLAALESIAQSFKQIAVSQLDQATATMEMTRLVRKYEPLVDSMLDHEQKLNQMEGRANSHLSSVPETSEAEPTPDRLPPVVNNYDKPDRRDYLIFDAATSKRLRQATTDEIRLAAANGGRLLVDGDACYVAYAESVE